jgi:hypothetical protein
MPNALTSSSSMNNSQRIMYLGTDLRFFLLERLLQVKHSWRRGEGARAGRIQAAKKRGLQLAHGGRILVSLAREAAEDHLLHFGSWQRSPDVEMGATPPSTPSSGTATEIWRWRRCLRRPEQTGVDAWSPVKVSPSQPLSLGEAPPRGYSSSGERDFFLNYREREDAGYAGMREDGWATQCYRFVSLEQTRAAQRSLAGCLRGAALRTIPPRLKPELR